MNCWKVEGFKLSIVHKRERFRVSPLSSTLWGAEWDEARAKAAQHGQEWAPTPARRETSSCHLRLLGGEGRARLSLQTCSRPVFGGPQLWPIFLYILWGRAAPLGRVVPMGSKRAVNQEVSDSLHVPAHLGVQRSRARWCPALGHREEIRPGVRCLGFPDIQRLLQVRWQPEVWNEQLNYFPQVEKFCVRWVLVSGDLVIGNTTVQVKFL